MNNKAKFKDMSKNAKEAVENFNDFADDRAILWADSTIKQLVEALKPFANYACEPPCYCHNCKARDIIKSTTI